MGVCVCVALLLTKVQSKSLEAVQKLFHITHNLTHVIPYSSTLLHINEQGADLHMAQHFFRDIMDPASCLHSLLPSPRSTAITYRLRSSQILPKVYTHTKRYCSFIQDGLNQYQYTYFL